MTWQGTVAVPEPRGLLEQDLVLCLRSIAKTNDKDEQSIHTKDLIGYHVRC